MRNRSTRGYSLAELVIVLVVMGIIATIAVSVYSNAKNETADSASSRTVESAADAQLMYLENRGEFATTAAALAELSNGDVTYTTTPSTGPKIVNVTATTYNGKTAIAIGVLATADRCITTIVDVDGSGTEPTTKTISGAATCTGLT